jgi:Tfp pilus assembly protein PilX
MMTEDRTNGRGIAINERGIAMLIALFMVLAMSVLGTSLMFVSRTETQSSQNYRLMSQARYAAESGVHSAVNYLLNTYVPPGTAGDPLANYVTTVSPVTYNNLPVVLTLTAATSNYPVAAVKTAFVAASQGTLDVKNGSVGYTATATLRSMRQMTDAYSGLPVTLQTWEVTGYGTMGGVTTAQVEVSALVERQATPVFSYAAFATFNGCAALSFAGGATTNSYDSTSALVGGLPAISNTFGNVGTNGNLTEAGNPTVINGSLSTPREGVGNCTANNVTAETINGGATVTNGLNKLSQEIQFPTPAVPNPLPPTTAYDFKKSTGCPAGTSYCTASANGATFTPPSSSTIVTLGDVNINAQAVLHLNAGHYVVNSFSMNGNSTIVVDSGPVVIDVAGVGQATPITITGNGISNTTYNPLNLEFVYAGTGEVKLAGGDATSALVYAPNATANIQGGADLYGAIVVKQLTATGGGAIHYDRHLQNSAMTAGQYMMSAFTWKSY